MAIVVTFDTPGMSSDQYDQCIKDLEAAGLESPDGRLLHVAAAKEDGWFVTDVWSSEEQFMKFGQSLLPILEAIGIVGVEPRIYSHYNTIA